MSRGLIQQVVVFAAVFLLLQVGLDWIQGRAVGLAQLGGYAMMTGLATVLYGGFLWWLQNRRNRGD